jgi:hypothetical protein
MVVDKHKRERERERVNRDGEREIDREKRY